MLSMSSVSFLLKSRRLATLPNWPVLITLRSLPETRTSPSSVGMITLRLVSICAVAEMSQLSLPSKAFSTGKSESTAGSRLMISPADIRDRFRLTPADMSWRERVA